jgi:hypothetical protein
MELIRKVLATLFAWRRVPTNSESEWHFYQRGLDLMRRKVDGQWEYRAMTDEEYRQYMKDRW